MPDELSGYGFTYNPAPNGGSSPSEEPTQLFAWQICLAHLEEGALEDASNYADYMINRDQITQTLGLGMANGQNAFQLDDQMFVVAISIQVDGEIQLIDSSYPGYRELSLVAAEQLLRGQDQGMIAQFPNGNLVPFMPPTNTNSL